MNTNADTNTNTVSSPAPCAAAIVFVAGIVGAIILHSLPLTGWVWGMLRIVFPVLSGLAVLATPKPKDKGCLSWVLGGIARAVKTGVSLTISTVKGIVPRPTVKKWQTTYMSLLNDESSIATTIACLILGPVVFIMKVVATLNKRWTTAEAPAENGPITTADTLATETVEEK